jgi:acyl-CoA thioester hydrolase
LSGADDTVLSGIVGAHGEPGMPRTHRALVTVREYEVDAFGELFPSALARFLQQAAVEASTAAGFDDEWYRRAGTVWVIRRSTIECFDAIRSGDALEITTYVADFRRVRSRREYEVRRAGTGERIAAAHTDWVYLDRTSARPLRVPAEMIAGFIPEGDAATLPRDALEVPEPRANAHAFEHRVTFRDIDTIFHVNNAVYLDVLVDAVFAALAANEWPLERFLLRNGRLRPRLLDVEYLAEARFGDELRCSTWPSAVPGERFGKIARGSDGAELTRARTVWEWSGTGGRPASMPDELAAALADRNGEE